MTDIETSRRRAPYGTANKVRERIAETLSSGYTLTDREIQTIAVEMGMSAASGATLKVGKEIHPFPPKHGRHAPVFFVDPALNLEEDTDFFIRLTEFSAIYGTHLSKDIILALVR